MKALLVPLLFACALALPAGPAAANEFEVVNGSAVSSGNYPWLVSLDYTSSGNAFDGHFCGGTLIHPQWVLTAAHCVVDTASASDITVTLGAQKLSDTSSAVRVVARRLLPHPAYNSSTHNNDVALVELSQAVNNIAVAKLAWPALSLPAGTTARSAGWGALAPAIDALTDKYPISADCYSSLTTCINQIKQRYRVSDTTVITTMLLANGLNDATQGIGYNELLAQLRSLGGSASSGMSVAELVAALEARNTSVAQIAYTVAVAAEESDQEMQVALPLVDNTTCAKAAGYSLTSNMLCAGYTNQPKDTCQGDSGGPLFVAHGNDWLQVGVVSFGGTCATTYGVYSKVSPYLDWYAQYVPHLNEDRLFNWGEVVAASLLTAAGNERSQTVAGYYARLYGNGSVAVGSDGSSLYLYSGGKLSNLGSLAGFTTQAVQAGY